MMWLIGGNGKSLPLRRNKSNLTEVISPDENNASGPRSM